MKGILFVLFAFSMHAFTPDEVDHLKERVLDAYIPTPMGDRVPMGWCSTEKALSFIDLTLEVKPQVCVEIGVFEGASLFPVAAALQFLKRGVVIAIDPWDFYECIRYYDPIADEELYRWWAAIDFEKAYHNFIYYHKYFKIDRYCKILRKTSVEAAEEIDAIDILHLDGDHSEFMSLKDVQLYLPKVRSGGYIWLNDALWKERGEAVDLLLEFCDVVKIIDGANCLLFKKR